MSKINLIIQREYVSRVKKRSFVVMTLLGPVIFASIMFLPGYFATREDKGEKTVAVVDQTHIMDGVLRGTGNINFEYVAESSFETLKNSFEGSGYYAILLIPTNILTTQSVILYSDQQTIMSVNSEISKTLNRFITDLKLQKENISADVLARINTNIRVETIQWSETGEEKSGSAELASAIGYISGFMMYMFIFMFGSMIMRAVIEEKTSRIVEVIISSVKPFQLMMGKVIGVSLVGLTQFMVWIVLTLGIVFGIKTAVFSGSTEKTVQNLSQTIMDQGTAVESTSANMNEAQQIFSEVFDKLGAINFPLIIGSFIFFFIGGYLLYASLFAAVGSAVDNETETQQFMLPITIPIIVGLMVMISAMANPHNQLAVIFSLIPLTSPIVMMARIPYGVPDWQLILSGVLLILMFLATIWMAAKIYRVGILMYGKKTSWKELIKWIRY